MLQGDLNKLVDFLDSICVAQNIANNSKLKVNVVNPNVLGNISDGNYMFLISNAKLRTLLSIDYSESKSVTWLKFEIQNTMDKVNYKQRLGEYIIQDKFGILTTVKIKLKGISVQRIQNIIIDNGNALYLA